MILEQNYRKVAQYTQKSFKLYSRRFLGHLILQVLQKKANINQFESVLPEYITNSKKLLRNTQIQQQNSEKDKEQEKNNVLNRTTKKIDAMEKQKIFDDVCQLHYKDFIYLEVYNGERNSSEKSQRLRVYLQLENIKYKNISHFQHQFNQQRSVFQIVNPFDIQSKTALNASSLFCLKDASLGKYLCSADQTCTSQNFGSKIVLNRQITHQCFLQFKGLQQQSTTIISHQPVGIKLGNYFLRAQGFDINCNIEGNVFYLNKLSWIPKEIQPQFVKIKNVSTQRFLSSLQLQITKIVNKKTFSNVTIQNQNGLTTKENQLVFATLDFDKYIQSDVQVLPPEQETLKNVWIIAQTQKDGLPSRQSVKLIHAPTGRCLIIKNDNTLKLCSNLSEASQFNINKKLYQDGFNSGFHQESSSFLQDSSQTPQQSSETNRIYRCQINYEDSNIAVSPNSQSLDKFGLSLCESSSLQDCNATQNGMLKFQIYHIDSKQANIILELLQIHSVLKKVYNFIEKVGFIFDDRNQTLKFCVEEIKKSNHQILYHNKIMSNIVSKINDMIDPKKQLQVSKRKIKNYMKELKILQTLILILKMINLKGGRKKRTIQASVQGQNDKGKLSEPQIREKFSETPFEICWRYFQPLQHKILHVIQFLVIDNDKCSTIVIQEANFFNKLLVTNPIKIGGILKQALRNLGFFLTNNFNNEFTELFQWATFIQGVSEKNIKLQSTYIDIISQVLVDPFDRGITSYQNKCRQILFNQRSKKKSIPRFGVQDQKPTITFESININDFLYANPSLFQLQTYSSSQPYFLIEDFFTPKYDKPQTLMDKKYLKTLKHQNYVDYLIGIIRLMRNLCKDRNKKLTKIADDYGFNRSHIIACLNSQKLDWIYKMQSLLLYSAIFVNQDPFLEFSRRQVKCHIWYKIKEYSLQSKTAVIFKQYTDLPSAIEKLKDFDLDILPFIENYLKESKKNIPKLILLIKKGSLMQWRLETQREMESFGLFTKFLFEVLDFGYLSIYHIKRFVYFTICHYQSICNLLEYISLSNLEFNYDSTHFKRMQQRILNQILKILFLHQKIWIDIICLNHVKIFQKSYSQKKPPLTAIELRQHCWKLLNHHLPIHSSDDQTLTFNKNRVQLRNKNSSTKNILLQQKIDMNDEDKLNHEVDEQIGKFLYRMSIVHSEFSQKECYNLLISMISQREKRNQNIYKEVSQILILNDKRQQNIYRDYSGRAPGKILNVNKIYQLILKIKTSFKQSIDDAENHKKTKEKLLQLNNLINKIRRQLLATKKEEMGLFKKMQQIISTLQIDSILSQLLYFSQNSAYCECISNLYKFYLEFIWENVPNLRKLSSYFELFLKNLRIQKSSLLISEVYLVLDEREKHKYSLVLLEKLHTILPERDEVIKQKALETLYRIIRKIPQKQLLGEIKSQLSYQIFKGKDYSSLLTMNANLLGQYINVLCELCENCDFSYQRIKHLYPKITLRKLLYQQHKYFQRSSILKLLYHFYIKNTPKIQTQDIEDLLTNFILPQMRHIPSVYQYLALQHLQINQQLSYRKQGDHFDNQPDMNSLKQKFPDLFSFEQNSIEPHELEKYWSFIYNIEDETEMSLINFTLSLLKMRLQTGSFKNSISKKLTKSTKYHNFIKYINQLCQFMEETFKKNTNQYQRIIQNKLQEILLLNQENKDKPQKTLYSTISEEDKKFLACFFEELSKIIVTEDISYRQILKCANISNIQMGKRRGEQNIERMILQEQFVAFIAKLGKHVNNTKQFTQIISGKKLHHFFNIYRSNKIRKINIYKFLEKLIQYLESLKALSINKLNEVNKKQRLQNESQNKCLQFQEGNNKNNLLETHFLSYYQRSEVVLKLLLKNKWRGNQQRYFQFVLEDLSNESLNQFIVPDNIINERKKRYLVQLYLSRMCCNRIKNCKELKQQQNFYCSSRMLATEIEGSRQQIQFQRLVLMILRQANKGKQINILISENGVEHYIRKKLEAGVYEQQNTLNEIIMELILNFNKPVKPQPYQKLDYNQPQQEEKEECQSEFKSQFRWLNNNNSASILTNRQSRRQLACAIYDELINTLQRDISAILGFDLRSTQQPYSSLTHQYNQQIPLSNNFKSKLQIFQYGLANGLLKDKHIPSLQSCFMSILYIWAQLNIDFSNHNWLIILQSIIHLIDKHLTHLQNFAHFLANCSVYTQRYSQLVNQCCLVTIKSTNVKSLTKISLLNLLTQFHIKFYLQKQQTQLAKILNHLDFQQLAYTASTCYQQTIQPKFHSFQNQLYCDLQDQQHRQICTYEFCNQQKLTTNDNSIMETFVTLLIIIQMSINLNNKKHFPYPLTNSNSNRLAQIDESLKKQKVSNNSDINWIEFYKKYIGLIYILSEDGTLITLHYKIPYIEKYCTNSFKEELIYLLKRDKETCIEKKLYFFSKLIEFELDSRKESQKIPLLSLILSNKDMIQMLIILVNFIHVILLLFISLKLNEVTFYPFTVVFILLRITFTISKYRKSLHMITMIYEEREKQPSIVQKVVILMKEKVLISVCLIVLYIGSFFEKQLFGFVLIMEILTLQVGYNFFILLVKSFVLNVGNILICFGVILIYFGVIDWNKGEDNTFPEEIINVFKQFYTFCISNLKAVKYDYQYSQKYPFVFLLYFILIGIVIYRNLLFFIGQMKKQNDLLIRIENRCIICNAKQIQIETQGQTFEQHLKFKHNIWHYLYFFIYLRKKSQSKQNLKTIELFIKNKIDNKNYGFINISNSH